MKQLKRLLKADIMKLKSTPLVWIHILVPLLGLALFLSYYSYAQWNDIGKISGYLEALCATFPVLIGIITSIFAEQEYMAGNYQNILNTSQPKLLTLVSKIILSLILGFLSTALAVLGFYFGFSLIGKTIFSFFVYIEAIFILLGSNVIIYVLHLFLSFRFSKSVSIGVGILESLISALFLTSMGDGIWPFVPCSWSMRFVVSLIQKHNGLNVSSLDSNLSLGVTMSIITTLISIVFLLFWFMKWEGKKAEE